MCQAVADPFGDHQVGGGGNGGRIHHHGSLRDALYSAAQSVALAPRREVSSLIPKSCSGPVDVYLPHWKMGLPAALDITLISTLQQKIISGASTAQGHALSVGKEIEDGSLCRSLPLSRGVIHSTCDGVNWRLE